MRSRFQFSFILVFVLVVSCDSNQVFDEYKTVPDVWSKDEVIQFSMNAPDTSNGYDLFVNIRNTSDYKYNNLFLIVELDHPNGKVLVDTLEYKMTAPDGSFLGTGFTDLKENKLWYRGYDEDFKFPEEGEYTVKIQHAMRKNGDVFGIDELQGITDIGFRIEESTRNQ